MHHRCPAKPGPSRRRLAPLASAALLLLAGCYSYVPVQPAGLQPQMRVRAFLTPEGSDRLVPVLGDEQNAVEGRLLERSGEGFFLEVTSAYVQEGMGSRALTQKVLLEPADFEGVQRRELNRTRTYLLLGVGGAALGALAYDALSGPAGGTVGGGPRPGPSEARLPIFTIPLP